MKCTANSVFRRRAGPPEGRRRYPHAGHTARIGREERRAQRRLGALTGIEDRPDRGPRGGVLALEEDACGQAALVDREAHVSVLDALAVVERAARLHRRTWDREQFPSSPGVHGLSTSSALSAAANSAP